LLKVRVLPSIAGVDRHLTEPQTWDLLFSLPNWNLGTACAMLAGEHPVLDLPGAMTLGAPPATGNGKYLLQRARADGLPDRVSPLVLVRWARDTGPVIPPGLQDAWKRANAAVSITEATEHNLNSPALHAAEVAANKLIEGARANKAVADAEDRKAIMAGADPGAVAAARAKLEAARWDMLNRADEQASEGVCADGPSADFRAYCWQGERFEFSKMQAAAVKVLWTAAQSKGPPELHQNYIIKQIDSGNDRLRDVFKKGKHPAWGTLIVKAGKGLYRLAF